MFFATEVDSEVQDNPLKLTHIRDRSVCKMQTFGTLPIVRYVNDKVVTTELKRVIREHSEHITVEFKGQFLHIRFEDMPSYIMDPVLCVSI